MERELCLVLDTLGKYRLVLKSGSIDEIDKYTSENFEDSSQIRKKYSKEINEFLSKHKDTLSKSNNPSYEGRIVIVIPEYIGQEMKYYQRKVLYKKHIVVFKEALKSKIIMMKFNEYQKIRRGSSKLVSDHFCYIIKQPWNNKNTIKRYINEWINDSKEGKKYYEIIRDMMIVYEQERQYRGNLLSIDDLYLKYKQEKEEKLKERIQKRGALSVEKNQAHTIVKESVIIDEDRKYYVNGNRYTVDELHLFDLEDINIDDDTNYIPDGVRKI